MYNGKMTEELRLLCEQYEKKWGSDYHPWGYEELEYGDDYRMFKRDVKRALKKGIELPDLYPFLEEEE